MKRPSFSTPNRICSTPAMMAMANTSVMLSTCVATMTDTATVMGAVGPETRVCVPPKSAANSPMETAA